jgi:hypothetical protein
MTEVKTPDHFTMRVGENTRDLKMTFGLLNELVQTVGDIEAVAEISFNSDLRNEILSQVFSERNKDGRIEEKVTLFNLDVDPDEVVGLLEWVGSHVTSFLLKQMMQTKSLMEKHRPTMMALTPT